MGTRALLQQQGHLINYDGKAARVGIKSDKLLKMAQSKLPNIEAAFQQLLNQPVKVSLEVAAPPPDHPPSAGSPMPAPPSPDPFPGTPDPAAATGSPVPQPPPAAAAPPMPPPMPDAAPSSPAVTQWQPKSDLDRAVKSFAEFFNGQIVDLSDDDEETDNQQAASKNRKGQSKPSSSPGSDVPF